MSALAVLIFLGCNQQEKQLAEQPQPQFKERDIYDEAHDLSMENIHLRDTVRQLRDSLWTSGEYKDLKKKRDEAYERSTRYDSLVFYPTDPQADSLYREFFRQLRSLARTICEEDSGHCLKGWRPRKDQDSAWSRMVKTAPRFLAYDSSAEHLLAAYLGHSKHVFDKKLARTNQLSAAYYRAESLLTEATNRHYGNYAY